MDRRDVGCDHPNCRPASKKKNQRNPWLWGFWFSASSPFSQAPPSLSSHLLQLPLSSPDPTKAPTDQRPDPSHRTQVVFPLLPRSPPPNSPTGGPFFPTHKNKTASQPPQTQILHPTATQRRSPLHSASSSSGQNNSHNSAAITGDSVAYGPRLFPHPRPQRRTSHDSLSPCSSAFFLQ
jgi:hypothetical protein